VRFFQQRAVARIAFDFSQQRINFHVTHAGVVLYARTLQPLECVIVVAAPGIRFGDLVRGAERVLRSAATDIGGR
jgi:hypothetical protein